VLPAGPQSGLDPEPILEWEANDMLILVWRAGGGPAAGRRALNAEDGGRASPSNHPPSVLEKGPPDLAPWPCGDAGSRQNREAHFVCWLFAGDFHRRQVFYYGDAIFAGASVHKGDLLSIRIG
jgi:hypothetical protein